MLLLWKDRTLLGILTKRQGTKISINGRTKEKTEGEEELIEEENLAVPTIPRKKSTIPLKLPTPPTM